MNRALILSKSYDAIMLLKWATTFVDSISSLILKMNDVVCWRRKKEKAEEEDFEDHRRRLLM